MAQAIIVLTDAETGEVSMEARTPDGFLDPSSPAHNLLNQIRLFVEECGKAAKEKETA